MIGSEALANVIAAIDWSTRENIDAEIAIDSLGDIPEGWEYIGSGAYRHVFKGPDNNVYKVLTNYAKRWNTAANQESYETYCDIVGVIDTLDLDIAKSDWFTDPDVFVQEFIDGDIDGDGPVFYSMSKIIRQRIGYGVDIHYNNVIWQNGHPILIDW